MELQNDFKQIKTMFFALKVKWEEYIKTFPMDDERGCRQRKVNTIALFNNLRRQLREAQNVNYESFCLIQDVLDAMSAPDFNYFNLHRDDFILRINRVLEQTEKVIIQNFGEF